MIRERHLFGPGPSNPYPEATAAAFRDGWFRTGDLGAIVSLWAMEYQPSYFALPEAAKEPAEGPDDMPAHLRTPPPTFAISAGRNCRAAARS